MFMLDGRHLRCSVGMIRDGHGVERSAELQRMCNAVCIDSNPILSTQAIKISQKTSISRTIV